MPRRRDPNKPRCDIENVHRDWKEAPAVRLAAVRNDRLFESSGKVGDSPSGGKPAVKACIKDAVHNQYVLLPLLERVALVENHQLPCLKDIARESLRLKCYILFENHLWIRFCIFHFFCMYMSHIYISTPLVLQWQPLNSGNGIHGISTKYRSKINSIPSYITPPPVIRLAFLGLGSFAQRWALFARKTESSWMHGHAKVSWALSRWRLTKSLDHVCLFGIQQFFWIISVLLTLWPFTELTSGHNFHGFDLGYWSARIQHSASCM